MVWLYQSGLGVMNAATNKIITTAYLRVLDKNLGVTIPIFVSKKTITGISNAIPHPKIRFVRLSK